MVDLINLLDENQIEDDSVYYRRRVNDDTVYLRAIELIDIKLINDIYNYIDAQLFLLARCIRSVNRIRKRDWDNSEWFKFINSLNWRDKRLFMKELRVFTYYEQNKQHPIYY